MRLRIQDILVQAYDTRLRKYEVKVLERLSKPERFHAIRFGWVWDGTVVQPSMGDGCQGVLDNVVEHCPSSFAESVVSSNTPEDKYGLDGLGSIQN